MQYIIFSDNIKATINWLQTTNQIKIFIVTKSNLQSSPQHNTRQ